jgi:AcrR family transcriptional regulator
MYLAGADGDLENPMTVTRRDSAKTKAKILRAARRLFAECDITSVSVRDIAAAAGVSHGLVQRYCGTREQMLAEIVRQEVLRISATPPLSLKGTSAAELAAFRVALRAGMAHFEEYARIIARAELAGIAPEGMLERGRPTPAMHLAEAIRNIQTRTSGEHSPLDPTLVSAYVNASLFAFATMAPWLMTTVGLKPDDYEARLDEILDISMRLIGSRPAPATKAHAHPALQSG